LNRRLRRQTGVGEAAVVVHSDGSEGKLLAGYIVAESGEEETTLLRTQLEKMSCGVHGTEALIADGGPDG